MKVTVALLMTLIALLTTMTLKTMNMHGGDDLSSDGDGSDSHDSAAAEDDDDDDDDAAADDDVRL